MVLATVLFLLEFALPLQGQDVTVDADVDILSLDSRQLGTQHERLSVFVYVHRWREISLAGARAKKVAFDVAVHAVEVGKGVPYGQHDRSPCWFSLLRLGAR